jgi:hypothetical protein
MRPTSVDLWHSVGVECVRTGRLAFAKYAFMQGLKCDGDNFVCLDKLICVLYLSADYSCKY